MQTRRSVLAVAGATVLAGCSSGGAQSTAQQSEPTNETESQADDSNLTAGEIHDNWANQDIRATAQTNASQSYKTGGKNQGIHTGIHRSIETLVDNLGHFTGHPEKYVKAIAGGLTAATPDSVQPYSVPEIGKSAKLNTSQLPVGRYWLQQDTQNDDGDVTDVLALLTPEHKATHLKGTQPENPTLGEQILLNYRNAEMSITLPPHDIEAIQDSIQTDQKEFDAEYDQEDIEEIYGSWLEVFDTMSWVDGYGVPVQDNWGAYHDDFHSVHPELMRQMAGTDEIGEGDVAAFTVDNGDVTLYSTVQGYDPEQDGMPTMKEVEQI